MLETEGSAEEKMGLIELQKDSAVRDEAEKNLESCVLELENVNVPCTIRFTVGQVIQSLTTLYLDMILDYFGGIGSE